MPIVLISGKCLVDCWRLIYKHHRILLFLLGLYISVGPSITKAHWVNHWKMLGGLLEIDL